jgi:NADPH-dependent 2,4-dienoyl-CoA reductase/sulfur reductase-like enzyme
MFVREANAADAKLRETWDRLVLLLIAEPGKGWEREFHEITRREVERLELPNSESESDE